MTYTISQYLQRWEIDKAVLALRAYFVEKPLLNRFTFNPHVLVRAMTAFFDIHQASIVHSETQIQVLEGTNECTIKMVARTGDDEPYLMVYSATIRESVNSSCSISVSTITP